MALIPYLDENKASPEVAELLQRLPVKLNIFRMLANAQTCTKPVMRLGAAILSKQKLSGKLRELAVLHAMKIEGGAYEWHQHVQIGLDVGLSEEQLAALNSGNIEASCFDACERAVLQFTSEVVHNVRASEETTLALARHLDTQEIVELLVGLGFYSMMARLTETTRTDLDAAGGSKVAEALRQRAGGAKNG
jgi:alkylhydroperoxidase family enzyme